MSWLRPLKGSLLPSPLTLKGQTVALGKLRPLSLLCGRPVPLEPLITPPPPAGSSPFSVCVRACVCVLARAFVCVCSQLQLSEVGSGVEGGVL